MAPVAGRMGDCGWTQPAAAFSDLLVMGAILLAWFGGSDRLADDPVMALGVMVGAVILLALGVVGDQTLGRRAINLLNPAARGHLNGLFTGCFFIGGACGSLAASAAWAGWSMMCLLTLISAGAACALSTASWLANRR
ncbi:MAG: hypothetical protein ABWY00_09630 [Dongiaceae bacterium]